MSCACAIFSADGPPHAVRSSVEAAMTQDNNREYKFFFMENMCFIGRDPFYNYRNCENTEQLHLITMQDCLQENVVVRTAARPLLSGFCISNNIYNILTGCLNNPYCYFTRIWDIMNLRKNQTAANQTFGFSGSLTGNYPVMQDKEHKVRIYKLHIERILYDRKHRDMSCRKDM